ncbi:LysR family transcriptional regulator [Porphyrobacter algicida]|uniref:LysR family transcriptional regulator n=1 Tax=Qipengyuania algicida TaxID=1836209 RepID=A0A845AJK8_9SPHN|nr:LysR family transcriptional regulator [Qipengyuania algicida]MXP29045.1 LysR family transcriptional regulator [Qipengyuania algicida]
MRANYSDLAAFAAVVRAGGFRAAAVSGQQSASVLSDAVKRLEESVGMRLLNRTTRKVATTEAGRRLFERLDPALGEVSAALDVLEDMRGRPAGKLTLNVPLSVVRSALMDIVPEFLASHPDITLDLNIDESFVDVVAAGCDAGIRYEERLEQDMIAIPIGPRRQRFAAAASPSYLDRKGLPQVPADLLRHSCLRGRFASGSMPTWEFEKDGQTLFVDPDGPMIVTIGAGIELVVQTAVAGGGIVYLFEDWLQPLFKSGELEPVLADWWPEFSGPFLYYPGRRLVPPPLRAFIDFVRRRPHPKA